MADGEGRQDAVIEPKRRRFRWLWLSLGVIGVVAVGAIAGILNSGSPGGVAHTVVTPTALGPYVWTPDVEKTVGIPTLASSFAKMGGGQVSGIRARTYEKPALSVAAPQLLEVIGGLLPSTSPASSIASFTQAFPGAHAVPAGSMGGSAACAEQAAGTAGSTALCVWFDNDTFGALMSPTLSAASLADLMVLDRPLIELVRK